MFHDGKMSLDKTKCRHPRRGGLLTRMSFIGEPTVQAINRFGIFVQKIAKTLRFETFLEALQVLSWKLTKI